MHHNHYIQAFGKHNRIHFKASSQIVSTNYKIVLEERVYYQVQIIEYYFAIFDIIHPTDVYIVGHSYASLIPEHLTKHCALA